ncbi:MAG: AAA family ATPase [Bacteroidetes bacterium]|jgi:predicted ATPase/signal transduction histidine kinase/predicted Ser/Thr protein kinase|nr:AAA family ATPase [Bacteroidota bacterium]
MPPILYENENFRLWRQSDFAERGEVLIKSYKADFPDPETIMMLNNEYNILRDCRIEGVRKLIDKTRINNREALVFEYIEGDSLADYLAKRSFSIEDFLHVAIKLSRIVGLVHDEGIIHKDINTKNILLTNQDDVYLIDFGIASRRDLVINHQGSPEMLQGHLPYISPEQTGRMNRVVDFRSDLYSLGIVFYEMLTGQLPFISNDPLEIIHAHMAVNPQRPEKIDETIPSALSDILMKLLSKNADDRYQSAYSLRADLELCLEYFEEGILNKAFKLGTKHTHKRFILPQKLYGRDQELQQLSSALSHIGQIQPQMVLIHGEPGVGKSALVKEIQKDIAKKGAIFISGKFDQYQRNIPYYAIQKALTEWVRIILTEKEEKLEEWKEIILDSTEGLGQLIVNLIPEIEIIIGQQPEVPELSGQEAQNRFNYVIGQFINAISRENSPLLIFIDDLQWADSASLDLISRWLEDKENHHFFVIGAYRDNEVDSTHPFQIFIDNLKKEFIPLSFLKLRNLELTDVSEFISDALFVEKKSIQALAEFVYEKTGGNPIFLKQFLMALHSEELLTFDPNEDEWTWDFDAINRLQLSDNIVDLMMSKIKRLPEKTQEIIKLAACIGNSFDANLLRLIAEIPLDKTIQLLDPAIDESLILPKDNNYRLVSTGADLTDQKIEFSFIHDRIQQSFYSLIHDEEKAKVHLQIGRLLDRNITGEKRNEKIFDIVFQLNTGLRLIEDPEEKIHLARLNLQAGTKAVESSAHSTALELVENGLRIMPDNAWDEHYELMHQLSEKGAEAAYLMGEASKMDQLINSVIEHSKTPPEQKKVYMLRIDHLTSQNMLPEGLQAGLDILEKLGVGFPGNPKMFHIVMGLAKTKWLLKGKQPEDLMQLEVMTDPNMTAALPILERIVPPAYMSGSNMFPLIVFKMVELSVKYGNMPYSAFGYGSYGISLSAVLGDYEGGYRFGQMALELVDKFDSEEYRVKVLFVTDCFLNHWKQHLGLSLDPLLESYKSGLKVGNLVGGIWAAYYYLLWQFYISEELSMLGEKVDSYKRTFDQLKQQAAYNRTSILQNVIQNLTTEDDIGLNLAGHFDGGEEKMLKELEGMNDKTSAYFYHSNKLLLHLLRLETGKALHHAEKTKVFEEAVAGLPDLTFTTFFASIAAIYHSLLENKSDSLNRAKKSLKKLKKWSESAPENYLHMYLAVEAGLLAASGKIAEANTIFDRAIHHASEQKYAQVVGMVSELAARFCMANNLKVQAELFMNKAYRAYTFWGAEAKANMLLREFDFLNTDGTSSSSGGSGSGGKRSGKFDLSTVVKASTSLSGEIRLNELLRTLLKIVIENAGAQRAILIMNDDDQLEVVAEGTIENIEIFDGINIKQFGKLPQSVVLYSIRTGEELIIPDASSHEKWSADEYIKNSNIKSLLCSLIKNQGKVKALLYLENNLTTNAFTKERVELLNMLSGQIAISIENANLYSNLEEKVKERTSEIEKAYEDLKSAQEQLIQQEKLASLGQLTAGIAHEIKNPLNFVNNFSELSIELIDEAKRELTAESSQVLKDLLNDIEANLETVHRHGSRADVIIKSLLQHSRGSGVIMEPTEINPLLKEFVNLSYHGMRAGDRPFEVDIEFELDTSIGEIPLISEDFSRVVVNLCNNAFDAMREKLNSTLSDSYSPKLFVRTVRSGSLINIIVEDNGTGIPKKLKKKILQPFFTTKKGTEGTGLGLYITNDIIRAHGGMLTIQSEENEFTRFVIELNTNR